MTTPAAKWLPAFAAAAVIGVVVVAGITSAGSDRSSTSPGGQVDTVLTVPASTSPAVVAVEPTVPKTQLDATLGKGMAGDQVSMVQERLKALGFDPGPTDGQFGTGTQQAVWAFEKLTEPNIRYDEVTGQVTNDMWQLMQDQLTFPPRRPDSAPGATHVEIYLDRQALIVYTDNQPKLITHISTGELDAEGNPKVWHEDVTYDTDENGNPLPEPVTKPMTAASKTPGGVFKIYRRYAGTRNGPLGSMWNPVYFNYGIAIHGAINVPDHPASHGCVRLPMFISEYFPSLVKNGDRVYVWDGHKEPEQQSKNDMLPSFNALDPTRTTTTTSTTTTTTTTVPKTTVPRPTVPATPPPTPAPAQPTPPTPAPTSATTSTTTAAEAVTSSSAPPT